MSTLLRVSLTIILDVKSFQRNRLGIKYREKRKQRLVSLAKKLDGESPKQHNFNAFVNIRSQEDRFDPTDRS